MSFDLGDFLEEEMNPEFLEVGKAYEFTVTTNDSRKLSKTFYIIEADKHKHLYKALYPNEFSNETDSLCVITKDSNRAMADTKGYCKKANTHTQTDFYCLANKKIVELGLRDTKTFVNRQLKSWSVRKKFGFKPATRKNRHDQTVEILSLWP